MSGTDSFLELVNSRRLILIGGKGGVGKSTMTGLLALKAAKAGLRVLAISTDPTPSLTDLFGVCGGIEEIRPVESLDIFLLELNQEIILRQWRQQFGVDLAELISTFAPVDEDFINYIGLAPGIGEEFVLWRIVEALKSGRYDLVLWDTAPAGHTLQLLSMPTRFLEHLEHAGTVYLRLYRTLESLRKSLGKKRPPSGIAVTIRKWKTMAEEILDTLSNRQVTGIVGVTIPESLGVATTRRMVDALTSYGLTLDLLVVNQAFVGINDGPWKQRAETHLRSIKQLRELRLPMVIVPLSDQELTGVAGLEILDKSLNWSPQLPSDRSTG